MMPSVEERMASAEQAQFNKAASDFSYNFVDNLGVERGAIWGHKGIWNQGDVREVIADRSPEQVLDAIAKASGNPTHKEVIDLIKQDPELAKAFHSSLQDPTMLDGFASIAFAGKDGFNMTDLKSMLANPIMRDSTIKLLEKVGDGSLDQNGEDISFEQVTTVLDQVKRNDKAALLASSKNLGIGADFDFGVIINFFKDIIDGKGVDVALANLGDNLGFEGEQLAAFKRLGVFPASVANLTVGDTHEYWDRYLPEIERGVTGLVKDFETVTGNTAITDTVLDGVFDGVFKGKPSDGTETKVSLDTGSILKEKAYDLAALGIKPTVTDAEAQNVKDYDAQTNSANAAPPPQQHHAFT